MHSPGHSPAQLAVVVPALDAAETLDSCLDALAEGWGAGLIGEVVLADGGSADATAAFAAAHGARVLQAPRGRGTQLRAGAAAATGDWLLFLHADTRLAPGWARAVAAHLARPDGDSEAGYFRLRFDDPAPAARRLERLAALRARLLALPYGDQGLLVSRRLYDAVGGFRPLPLMEDVDLVRRLGRRRLVPLGAVAITSARRYRRHGYAWRMARNLGCLTLYFLGLPPRVIARLYA